MKKKTLTLIELVVYLFIVSFVWFFVVVISRHFFDILEKTVDNKNFINSFNKNLNTLFQNSYNWWDFDSSYNTWIVFSNSWNYFAYKCLTGWIWLTYNSTWMNFVNEYYQLYTWFECKNITAYNYLSGYWIEYDLVVSMKSLHLKYFIYPK